MSTLPTHDDPVIERFLQHVAHRAHEHGVAFVSSADERIAYPMATQMMVSGYFIDRPQRALGMAMGKSVDQWLPILVHEYCHMEQWIANDPAWAEAFCEGRETVDWIDMWLEGEDNLPLPIAELIRRSRSVELDCEQRAVAMIEQFDLPIDVPEYIQKANAYVFFYNHLLHTRQWYPNGQAPYECVDVWTRAPNTFPANGETPETLARTFHEVYPAAVQTLSRPKTLG